MNRKYSHLEECLERVRRGENPEIFLNKYPGEAEELRSLLKVSGMVQRLNEPLSISPEFIQNTQAKLESAWREKYDSRGNNRLQIFTLSPRLPRMSALVPIILVVAILFGFAGSAKASENAMPGSLLYPLKLSMERVYLTLTFSNEKKIDRLIDYTEARASEIVYVSGFDDEKKIEASLTMIESNLNEITRLLVSNEAETTLSDSLNLHRIEDVLVDSSTRVRETLGGMSGLTMGQVSGLEGGKPDITVAVSGNQSAPARTETELPGFTVDSEFGVTPDDSAPAVDSNTGDSEPEKRNDDEKQEPASVEKPEETDPGVSSGTDDTSDVSGSGDADKKGKPDETGQPDTSGNSSKTKDEVIGRVDKAYEKTISEVEKAKENQGKNDSSNEKGNKNNQK